LALGFSFHAVSGHSWLLVMIMTFSKPLNYIYIYTYIYVYIYTYILETFHIYIYIWDTGTPSYKKLTDPSFHPVIWNEHPTVSREDGPNPQSIWSMAHAHLAVADLGGSFTPKMGDLP